MRRLLAVVTAALSWSLISGQAQIPFSNGLVAYYPFEGNGNDGSGNGNHATPAGNYQFVTNGLSGAALRTIGDFSQFYSGGGHVLLPAFSTNLNSGCSVCLWVKDEVPGTGPVDAEAYVSFQSNPADSAFRMEIDLVNRSPLYVGYFNGNGSGVAVGASRTVDLASYANSWKHLALITSPGKFACFFNGSNIYETNVSYSVFPTPYAALGRHWWPGGSSARMSVTYDNVRIYGRALSDQEVQELYAYEKNPLPYLTISVKTIRLTLFVEAGKSYQLESSINLQTWTDYGSPFVAFFSPVIQDVDVVDGYRYFRIRQMQ